MSISGRFSISGLEKVGRLAPPAFEQQHDESEGNMSMPVIDRFPLRNERIDNSEEQEQPPYVREMKQHGLIVKMDELERELNKHDPTGDIAALVRKLTYGEMVELAAAIWAARPDDAAATNADWLAPTLHRWATAAAANVQKL
jgi:hypothetical protein